MTITDIEYRRYDLLLAEPYTIAYQTIDKATNFVLKLTTDSGLVGYGCAAPDKVVTGESGDDVDRSLRDIIAPALRAQNPFRYAKLLEELRPRLKSSALAMVDGALYDLLARRANLPLYQLLGGYRDNIATSVTVGILSMEETLRRVGEYMDQGFRVLKLKGGHDHLEDIERLRAVRRDYPDITLRFDGNQGYDLDQALHFISAAQSLNLEMLEQPTRVGEDALMGTLSRESDLAVMADESLKSLGDAFRLTRHELTDMFNIKLQKVGGLRPGLRINAVARSAANEVMVGCLDECVLGIAFGLHFALSQPNIRYADLDGHLDILNDPFAGKLFAIENGIMRPNNTHAGVGKIDLF